MRSSETWICVADGTRAQFYLCDGNGHDIVPTLDYMLAAPSRAHNLAMTTDRPGRSFPSAGWGATAGWGRHAFDEGDWQEEEKCRFAGRVAGVPETPRDPLGVLVMATLSDPSRSTLARRKSSEQHTNVDLGERRSG